jgi:ketosteroid isomerase-like protein
MSTEENKALFSRLLDELNRGNLEIVDQVVAPDALMIAPHLPEPVRGRQAFKDVFGGAGIEALAMQYTLEQSIAEDDSVAARFTARGTHQGEFQGAAPTGKPVTLDSVVIYRVANGQIVEYRLSWDTLGFLQQVGAIPATGGTS